MDNETMEERRVMELEWTTAMATHAEAVLSRLSQQVEDYERAAEVWRERGLVCLAEDAEEAAAVALAAARLLAEYRGMDVARRDRGMQVQAAKRRSRGEG
jgi:hypothetical protein